MDDPAYTPVLTPNDNFLFSYGMTKQRAQQFSSTEEAAVAFENHCWRYHLHNVVPILFGLVRMYAHREGYFQKNKQPILENNDKQIFPIHKSVVLAVRFP